jgi:hypothetical protein
MALPVVVVVGVLALQGVLGDAVQDVMLWPLQQYRRPGGINDFPYGTTLPIDLAPVSALPGWYGRLYHMGMLVALPPFTALGALLWLVGWLRPAQRLAWDEHQARLALLAGWVVLTFLVAVRGRGDLLHIAMYGVPASLLACIVASGLARRAWRPDLAPLACLPTAALVAFMATGALMMAKAIAKEPYRWNHPWAPETYMQDSPAIRYLKAHARPGDRMVAVPEGGFYYWNALPPGGPLTIVLTPEMGYGTPAEFDAYWAEVARRRPRYILIQPAPWDAERSRKRFEAALPPRYHPVAKLVSPQYNWGWPATLYEAD